MINYIFINIKIIFYLELLLVQLVQLELACKKMGPVMVLFHHPCFVTGPRMVEYLVVVQEVLDFQEFRAFQVALEILVLLHVQILLLVQMDHHFRMIRMSPQEFHLEVGHSFLEVLVELELPKKIVYFLTYMISNFYFFKQFYFIFFKKISIAPETLQDISDNILPEECKAESDNLFPDS